MKNEVIENLLLQIVNTNHNSASTIAKILDEYEQEHIFDFFNKDKLQLSNIDQYDLKIKLDALTVFIYRIYNTPSLANDYFTKDSTLLIKLLEIAFGLYSNLISTKHESLDIKDAILTSLYGILSDKVVELHYALHQYLEMPDNPAKKNRKIEAILIRTWKFFLLLTKNIASKADLEIVNGHLASLNEELEQIQDELIAKDSLEINDGIYISIIANLVYIFQEYYYYLLHGESSEGGRFIDKLNTYLYNAAKYADLINDNLTKMILVLMKEAFEKLYQKSLWQIANITPEIHKFITHLIQAQDHIVLNLLPSQQSAVADLFSAKKSIVINMPTSSGKTLLAQLYILYKMKQYQTGETYPLACYVVPTNALINQTKKKFEKDFSCLNFVIETVLPFYESDQLEKDILKSKENNLNILIVTPEKLDFMIRNNHPALDRLRLIIMDEAHNLADEERGSKFELLLAAIKQERPNIDFLLLSPFIENAKEIAKWLGETSFNSTDIKTLWSPNKQYMGYFHYTTSSANITYIPSSRNNIIRNKISIKTKIHPKNIRKILNHKQIKSIDRLIPILEQFGSSKNTLILCESPKTTEECVETFLNYLKKKPIVPKNINDESVLNAIEIIALEQEGHNLLTKSLLYGVAYHHARMSDLIKSIIEDLMIDQKINFLFATTTLAQGMNFPFSTVVFDFHTRRGTKGLIPANDFWNIAGRAGRAFIDNEGHIILKQSSNDSEKTLNDILKNYIETDTKDIVSSLKSFFDKIDGSTEFNLDLLNTPSATNFIQYLNHILRVIHKYNFEIDTMSLQTILNNSLIYNQNSNRLGFIQSQDKVRDFCDKYVNHLKGKQVQMLTLADMNGISDISLSTLYSEYKKFIELLQENNADVDQNKKASHLILDSHDSQYLGSIIQMLNKVPEFKLDLDLNGKDLDAKLIAQIIIKWVNGIPIQTIAQELYTPSKTVDFETFLSKCNKYVHSKMKTFVPWGISVYQTISDDKQNEIALNLPSFIYYGVNNIEMAILSKIGVPRAILNPIKSILQEKGFDTITIANMDRIKNTIQQIDMNTCIKYDNKIGKSIYQLINKL